MAASLFKVYTQFSSVKQSLANTIKKDKTTNILHNLIPCFQYQNYYATPICCKRFRYPMVSETKVMKHGNLSVLNKNRPVVEVWKLMTPQDVANVTERPIKNVLLALGYVDSTIYYNRNTVIENMPILYSALKVMGFNYKTVSNPYMKHKTNKDYDVYKRPPPEESKLVKRHPVVTIMGHVDHGKTTLLDALRNTTVADTEFGGITQHIGAFNVTLATGERVTFLDTPGHAAFNAMRSRGAEVTDIVVLVVAADDGVMEQTKESIRMAKSANVPIIVAINKIDKPQQRTQEMLAENDVEVEQAGGNIQSVNISALKKTNLNLLTEAIVLQAELMELKGDPKGLVEGVVIECSVVSGAGKLATVLIQRGTLRKGSILVSGTAWVKVRSMFNHRGEPVLQATLSEAVEIIGWKDLPNVGDEILEVESEHVAQIVKRFRENIKATDKAKEHKIAADRKYQKHLEQYKVTRDRRRLEKLMYKRIVSRDLQRRRASFMTTEQSTKIQLNVILKGDVIGSVEAILDVLDTYSENDKCHLNIVHYGIGPVTENDIELATVFNGVIYCFNVKVPSSLEHKVRDSNIPVRRYKIIYQLINDVKQEIVERLPVSYVDEVLGEAIVLEEFEITDRKKKVKVAGCRCTKGILKKNVKFRVMRNNEVLGTGRAVTMRHLKNEVDTIKQNVECGIVLDIPVIMYEPGDILICFQTKSMKPDLNWDTGF